jgi:hypothetical protein
MLHQGTVKTILMPKCRLRLNALFSSQNQCFETAPSLLTSSYFLEIAFRHSKEQLPVVIHLRSTCFTYFHP